MGSAVLVGFGDAAIINLAIMSKFVLYKKKYSGACLSQDLEQGPRPAVNNLVHNLAAAVGNISFTRDQRVRYRH